MVAMRGRNRRHHSKGFHSKRKRDPWGEPPWTARFRPKRRALPERVDFATVGAGFAGLSAAAHLTRMAPHKSVLVLEAGRLGNGASGRTGGMALDETAAGKLPGLGKVLHGYKQILRSLRIHADAHFPGVWEIGRGGSAPALDSQSKHLQFRKRSAIHWNDSGDLRIVRKVPGGGVDPKKVVAELARAVENGGAHIAENAEVLGVHFGKVLRLRVRPAGNGSRQTRTIEAGGLHVAGTPPAAQAKLTFALATAPMARSAIAALGLADGRPFYTVDLPYVWGRLFDRNRIIFGSGLVPAYGETARSSAREKKKLWGTLQNVDVQKGEAADRLRTLERRVRGFHPALKNVKITHRWGGPILITEDWRPVFRHHPKSKRVVVLGGFSGHGVALSVYLGRWAAQALLGQRPLPRWH
jgi:gamma-glutamylputrescine oxidase